MKQLFIERWNANHWAEKDEPNDQEFLEGGNEIYLKMFPESVKLLNKTDLDEQDNIGVDMTVVESGEDDHFSCV